MLRDKNKRRVYKLIATGLLLSTPAAVQAGVIHGQINVVQHNGGNSATDITLSTPVASPGFGLNGGNRGDYNLSTNMTVSGGIVISAVRQHARDNDPFGGFVDGSGNTILYNGPRYATSAIDRTGTGSNAWFIPVFNTSMGSGAVNDGGDEFNANVAAAYFPYTEYLGGYLRNSAGTNGGANDQLFTGTSLIAGNTSLVTLGTHVIDQSGGLTTIDFRSLSAHTKTGTILGSSASGILLAVGGKNEDNYAMSRANADGTFTVFNHDNGVDGNTFEQDPVGFVYLAKDDPNAVALGRIIDKGNGNVPDIDSGASSGNFTVTKGTTGIWYLQIPGHSESTGTLIVTPAGDESGNTSDNVLVYEWDPLNTRWEIQTRDMRGMGLQNATATAGTGVPVFSFAFFAVPEPTALGLIAPAGLMLLRRRTSRR